MLSKRQFACATGATEKWVDNAGRLLGRRFDRTEGEARWLGLVFEMVRCSRMRISRAAALATKALQANSGAIPLSRDAGLRLLVDLDRYHTRCSLRLSAAMLDGKYRRGPSPWYLRHRARSRPAILSHATAVGLDTGLLRGLALASPAIRARALGEDVRAVLRDLVISGLPHVVIGDVAAVLRGVPRNQPRLEVCYAGDGIARVAALAAHWNARPLGVRDEYPFVTDEQIVQDAPVLALAIHSGAVVFRRASDAEFAALAAGSDILELGHAQPRVLRLESLASALRASRRRVPLPAILELEAAQVVLRRVD